MDIEGCLKMAKVDCNKIPYAKAQREIKALLNSIRSYFKSEYNMDVRVAIDYGMDVNLAKSSTGLKTKPSIVIGMKNARAKSLFYIDRVNYTTAIVNIFHEMRHLENKFNGFIGCCHKKEDDVYIALSYMAQQGNIGYYSCNYYNNPYEIDAEYNGLKEAHNYLSIYFGKSNSEKMLVDYVNHKNEDKNSYFVEPKGKKYFQSYDEILKSLKNLFQESKRIGNRDYRDNQESINDEALSFIKSYASDEVVVSLHSSQNSIEYDKKIASIVSYIHPDYKKQIPVLNDVDLSFKSVFKTNIIFKEQEIGQDEYER